MKNKLKALFTIDSVHEFWINVAFVVLWTAIIITALANIFSGVGSLVNLLIFGLAVHFITGDFYEIADYWHNLEDTNERD